MERAGRNDFPRIRGHVIIRVTQKILHVSNLCLQYEVFDTDVPASGDGHPSPDPIPIEIDRGNESEVVSERPQGRSSAKVTWPSDCIIKPIPATDLVESGHISPAAHPNYKKGTAESNLEILKSEEAPYISPEPVQAVASTDVTPSAHVPRRNGNENARRSSENVTVNANVFTLGSKEGIGKPLRTVGRRLSGCEPQAVDINGKDVPSVPQSKEHGISADRGTETAIQADVRQTIMRRNSLLSSFIETVELIRVLRVPVLHTFNKFIGVEQNFLENF
ncbi:hypothetical protein FGB62_64g033 [Gracilaria domingensis]|nr:hypothetical protein FGB62_64g033 [Gracilaria domingensis]